MQGGSISTEAREKAIAMAIGPYDEEVEEMSARGEFLGEFETEIEGELS